MDRRTFLLLAGTASALGTTELARDRAATARIRPPVRASSTAAATVPQTATVPLRIVDIGGGQTKIGIEIALGGGSPRLYTFDTGSSGFYAAFNRDWWPSYRRVGGAQIAQSYGDDDVYQSKIVRTTVSIPSSEGDLRVETEIGQIHDAWGGGLGTKSTSKWRKDVAAGKPPLFGHFFGDFGSGLREQNGLFAVLPQLPGNLSSGFAVRVGCGGGPSLAPTLEVGLTDEIRDAVTNWIPMSGGPQTPPYPLSGRPTYAQSLVAGDFSLQGYDTAYSFTTHAILDTGGPTTDIHQRGDELKVPESLLESSGRRLRSDVLFRVSAQGGAVGNGWDLEFTTGDVMAKNLVAASVTSTGRGFVNLGLIPFFRYTVVFDLERGLVGFGPCG
jgi:hypothetical protein